WYQDLPNKTNDTIYLAVAWVIGSILSYSAFYLIKDIDEQIFHTSRLLPWFVLINFINLLWVVVFYIYKSFTAAAILILSILLIEFYIILLLLYVNVYAALLNLPIFILYIYLLYSIVNLASRNFIIFYIIKITFPYHNKIISERFNMIFS